ncbi:MAG: alpha-amylase family glycosyl hydrolase [Lachnospiraceae bacterium]|nr:alpha-amylase family glycosyl hydrolase [Lachnospiraceae bacterium]
MNQKNTWQALPGDPTKPGISRTAQGFNFTVHIPTGASASLLLYKKGNSAVTCEIPLPENIRVGEVSAIKLEPMEPQKWEYNYCIDGKVCQDEYAQKIIGREKFGAPMSTVEQEHGIRCGMIELPTRKTAPLQIPYEDSIIYKIHVRGFTKHTSSKVRKKGTFSGIIEKIPYLKELGVTALELMPAYEFFELPRWSEPASNYRMDPTQPARVNYWGYGPALYFAPKASFAATADPCGEFSAMVDALHEAGIECIMEFYFPEHTEAQLVLDVLHFWQLTYGIDGFHLLGDGNWLEMTARDSLLKKTKLSYVGFDTERIYGNDKRPYYRNLCEHNLAFQQDMRKFLKGDEGCLEAASYRMRRNPVGNAVLNFFADHDGYTMQDMVSYEQKHNLENGEDNSDGSNLNYSWNCGVEGETRKHSIRRMRERQLRNAWVMLLGSQGTPMIYGGDELCNTAHGNNNPYCQDNEIGWQEWNQNKVNLQMLDFVKQAIAFRKKHPVLHQTSELKMMDYKSYGCPDLSYHGSRAWFNQMEYNCRFFGAMYCGDYVLKEDESKDCYLFFAYNMHWEEHEIALPTLPKKQQWHLAADTGSERGFFAEGEEELLTDQRNVLVPPRTIYILTGRQE